MADNLDFVSNGSKECDRGKKAEFGTRFLDTPGRVFEHNAWDAVEWSQEQKEEAEKKIALNSAVSLSVSELEEQRASGAKAWHAFYQQHSDSFFKDRNWLLSAFPELAFPPQDAAELDSEALPLPACDTDTYSPTHWSPEAEKATVRILDAGCGVGNSTFPILESNPSPGLFIYACDFAESAVGLVKANPQFNPKHLHAFVCDLSADSAQLPFPPNCFHFILLLFVLSAVSPCRAAQVVSRLARQLRPGGLLLFRDYGRHDMAQLRFKPGACLQPNCYRRGDGTQAYFFSEQEVSQLFEQGAGLQREQLVSDRRLQVNRGKQIKMYRVWIQAKFRKPH